MGERREKISRSGGAAKGKGGLDPLAPSSAPWQQLCWAHWWSQAVAMNPEVVSSLGGDGWEVPALPSLALRAPQEPPQLPLGQLSPTTLLEPTPPTHAGQTHLWLCIWGARPQHPQIRVTTPRDPAPTQQGRAQSSGPSTNTLRATNEPRGAALSPPAPNPFLPPTQPESVRGRGWGTQSQHRTSSNCSDGCTEQSFAHPTGTPYSPPSPGSPPGSCPNPCTRPWSRGWSSAPGCSARCRLMSGNTSVGC